MIGSDRIGGVTHATRWMQMNSEATRVWPDGCAPEDVIGILRALADPNRLRIVDFLMQGDSCNCELNENLGLPPNLLSHHLRVLREAGLTTSRRDAVDGRWIYYSVDRDAAARWRSWFEWFLDPGRVQERAVLCGPEGMGTARDERGLVQADSCASGRRRRCG